MDFDVLVDFGIEIGKYLVSLIQGIEKNVNIFYDNRVDLLKKMEAFEQGYIEHKDSINYHQMEGEDRVEEIQFELLETGNIEQALEDTIYEFENLGDLLKEEDKNKQLKHLKNRLFEMYEFIQEKYDPEFYKN